MPCLRSMRARLCYFVQDSMLLYVGSVSTPLFRDFLFFPFGFFLTAAFYVTVHLFMGPLRRRYLTLVWINNAHRVVVDSGFGLCCRRRKL